MLVSFALDFGTGMLHIFAGAFYGLAGCGCDGEEKSGEE
jgi:hypothetical protein